MQSMIPVDDETHKRMKNIKETYWITYDDLLNALLDEVDTDKMNLDEIGDDVMAHGGTHAKRRDNEVRELINENQEDEEIIDKAMWVVSSVYDKGEMLESHPHTVAASAVYLASVLVNKKEPQKQLAQKYQCSTPTIGKKYKTMIDLLGL